MSLLDHFHPPVSQLRGWEGFHNGWAHNIANDLNRQLVPPWYAEANLHFGLEIDVAAIHRQFPEPLEGFAAPVPYAPEPPAFEAPISLLGMQTCEQSRLDRDLKLLVPAEH